MRVEVACALIASGCFAPSPPAGAPCSPNGMCPRGQQCDQSQAIPVCVVTPGGVDPDAPGDVDASLVDASAAGDAAIDAPPSVVPPGAVLWLKLDDPPANGVADSAGSHTATCSSCPAVVPGRVGSAYEFTSDQIDLPDVPDLRANTAFTVTTWLRLAAQASGPFVLCKTLAQTASFCFNISPGNVIGFYTGQSSFMGPVLSTTVWHHLALTWNGTTAIGYVDGVNVGSAATPAFLDDGSPMQIGGYKMNASGYLLGALDEIMFYPRALTLAEVNLLADP